MGRSKVQKLILRFRQREFSLQWRPKPRYGGRPEKHLPDYVIELIQSWAWNQSTASQSLSA